MSDAGIAMSDGAIDNMGNIIVNPGRNPHLKDEQRGDDTKNDWYSFVGITLSFKLNNNTKGCYP